MNFERGQDPKKSLGIGMESMLEEIGGILVPPEGFQRGRGFYVDTLKSEYHDQYYQCGVMIAVFNGNYKILKNRYSDIRGTGGLEKDLPKIIKEIYDIAKPWLSWSQFGLY